MWPPPAPRSARFLPAAVLVVALAVTGCSASPDDPASQGDLASLRAEFEALEARELERDEQLGVLETTARQLERDDPLARLNETDAELARVVDALTVLEEELAIDRETRAEADAEAAEADAQAAETIAELRADDDELRTTVAGLRDDVTAARGRIDELRAEIDELRTLYTTLRDRFDRLQRGG